ncbi:MAG: EamA family transporter [Anaerolineales bacterium]|nr:EamA family transporter [Anaerolineales bacterium]
MATLCPAWATPATANLGRANLRSASSSQNIGWADSLLALTTIFWAVNFSVVKFALAELPPLAFNGLRMMLAAGLMLALVPALGYSLKFQRHHLGRLLILGLLGNTSYQLCFIFGIARTTADNAALILATVPAWVALIGTLAGTEKITAGGWMGVLLSLAGISLIVLGGSHQARLQFGGTTLPGDALILGATLCWSLYTLASRRLLRDYSPIAVTSFTTAVGIIPLVILAIPPLLQLEWSNVSLTAWGSLVFSGVFSITLAYFFWNFGVSRLGSTRTSLYSNLTPPLALLTAWLLLGETLTLLQLGGGLLALAGVALARRYTYALTEK